MALQDLNIGALAPVSDEVHEDYPETVGAVPSDLRGLLVRNGPNPYSGKFSDSGVLNWWPEAAMLHAVAFAGGKAISYRNRWLRTRNWAEAFEVEHLERYHPTNPNVNVIQHAGDLMALAEGGPPLVFDKQLRTIGLPKSHTAAATGMTAHPKVDPYTGELISFRQSWAPPYLQYRVADAAGAELVSQDVDMASPSMMHDMAITATSSIFLDLGVSLDFKMLERGHRLPIRWHEERDCRFGIVPRHGGEVKWVNIEPCFIQHVVNAYDEADGSITLHVARYPWYFKFDEGEQAFATNPMAQLWRYRINPGTGTVSEGALDSSNIELPRINEAYTGHKNRYVYAVEQPTDEEMRGIIKYDLETGATQRYALNFGDQNSEPVFVPRANHNSEDDGWLLICVYRQATERTEIHIVDARDITQPPAARVILSRRIPAGFHGAWLADD